VDKKLLTAEEAKSIDYYDKFAKEWSDKHAGGSMFDPEIGSLFELFPKGKVLEVGVGQGEDAVKLIEQYGVENYVGCEPAEGLLKIAQKNNPGARLVNISVYELERLKQKFDIFWISAMIIHISKTKLNKVLGIVYKVINKGGGGFISIMEGEADMEESRLGRHYSLWKQEEFEGELNRTGFEVINKRRIETKASPWLAYLLRVV
jgi:SAM-dependent methyltransferase